MIPKPSNEITEADIQEIKANGVPEGNDIEYKRELPGTSDEQKREFLADVSSFANTGGGDIIYGVAENQGVITEIAGLSSCDFDVEILRLENLMRDGVAPRSRQILRAQLGGQVSARRRPVADSISLSRRLCLSKSRASVWTALSTSPITEGLLPS